MKRHLGRIFTIPNLLVFLSALYICFKVYETPAEVKMLKERMYANEKEVIVLKENLKQCVSMLSEVKADVKQILKDVK